MKRSLCLAGRWWAAPPAGWRLHHSSAALAAASKLVTAARYPLPKPNLVISDRKRYGLLVFPAICFALAYWQVHRKKWKEALIRVLEEKTKLPPVPLPDDLAETALMEYQQVRLRGEFDHSREVFLLNRTYHNEKMERHWLGSSLPKAPGYHVVTPFRLADRKTCILVDRGWISKTQLDPATRQGGQVKGVVELTGVVRLNETPSFAGSEHAAPLFNFRDIASMAQVCGCAPILVEATAECDVAGGPLGGQTVVTLRNQHLSYILTWASLGSITLILWLSKFGSGAFRLSTVLSRFSSNRHRDAGDDWKSRVTRS